MSYSKKYLNFKNHIDFFLIKKPLKWFDNKRDTLFSKKFHGFF